MNSAKLERALLFAGVLSLAYYGLASVDAAYREQAARAEVARVLSGDATLDLMPSEQASGHVAADVPAGEEVTASESDARVHAPAIADAAEPNARSLVRNERRAAVPAKVVGLLEIPRLNLATPVLEGDDADTLRGAAGHLPDTPPPWEDGNSAIAAHRDGIFRPLRHIRIGDELLVRTSEGDLRYRVSDTHIVEPTDVSVLEAKSAQMLTLITCYPFNFVGSAPQRFIVHAERVIE